MIRARGLWTSGMELLLLRRAAASLIRLEAAWFFESALLWRTAACFWLACSCRVLIYSASFGWPWSRGGSTKQSDLAESPWRTGKEKSRAPPSVPLFMGMSPQMEKIPKIQFSLPFGCVTGSQRARGFDKTTIQCADIVFVVSSARGVERATQPMHLC